jgi:hypothetical protein
MDIDDDESSALQDFIAKYNNQDRSVQLSSAGCVWYADLAALLQPEIAGTETAPNVTESTVITCPSEGSRAR